jgi:hypothetical protein
MSVNAPENTQNDAPKDLTRDEREKVVTPATKKDASKAKASRKGHFTKDASLSQVVAKVAQLRDIDATRAGKLVRSHIRANFDNYAKGAKGSPKWGALTKSKENKDGNRYPIMPPSVANAITQHMTVARTAQK